MAFTAFYDNRIRQLFSIFDLYYQFHYLDYLWRAEIIANTTQ